MSVKTLEFLSARLLVLTTSIGARGLAQDCNKSGALIINDNPSTYPEQIKKLIKNPKLKENYFEATRDIYRRSSSEMGQEYILLYEKLSKKKF